jgi:hypothetical protein
LDLAVAVAVVEMPVQMNEAEVAVAAVLFVVRYMMPPLCLRP